MTPDSNKRKTVRFKNPGSPGRAGSRKPLKDPARTSVGDRTADGSQAPAQPEDRAADRDLKIRERAFRLFISSGCQHGHDLDHWLEAERQVTMEETGSD